MPGTPPFRHGLVAALVIGVVAAAALSGGLVVALSRDGEEPRTRTERWQADLRFLEREMRGRHPNLFFSLSKHEFERRVDLLAARIPRLTDSQLVFEFASLVASISAKGRDGHSHVHVLFGSLPTPGDVFPLRLYWFSDGVVVADAIDPYRDLIGRRVLGIGSSTIDEAIEALGPAIARDNELTFRARVPLFLVYATLLEGARVIPAAGPARWRFAGEGNVELVREIAPVAEREFLSWLFSRSDRALLPPVQGRPTPLALRNLEQNFWASLVPDSNALYVGYNAVEEKTQSGETLADFAGRLASLVQQSRCPPPTTSQAATRRSKRSSSRGTRTRGARSPRSVHQRRPRPAVRLSARPAGQMSAAVGEPHRRQPGRAPVTPPRARDSGPDVWSPRPTGAASSLAAHEPPVPAL